jgi:hypothetical protein
MVFGGVRNTWHTSHTTNQDDFVGLHTSIGESLFAGLNSTLD